MWNTCASMIPGKRRQSCLCGQLSAANQVTGTASTRSQLRHLLQKSWIVVVHIATDHDLPRSFADELRAIVREQMGDDELTVYVVALRGLWRSDHDEGVTMEE